MMCFPYKTQANINILHTTKVVGKLSPKEDRAGNVVIYYQDELGEKIAEEDILEGKIGDPFTTSPKKFEEYIFKEVLGSISGKFTDQIQNVVYVYSKNKVDLEFKPDGNSKDKVEINNNINLVSQRYETKLKSTKLLSQFSLPKTGENDFRTMMIFILGLITLTLVLFIAALHFKKSKNNNR